MLSRVLILTFLLYSVILSSQNTEPKVLKSTERQHIDTLLLKADGFYKVNLDSALFYMNKAKQMVQPYDEPELKAKTLLRESKYLLYKKEYGTIITTLAPNIQNIEFLSDETLGRTYKDIGHVYKQKWLPDSALVNYIKALKLFEKTNNKRDISLIYLSLGLVYSKIGNKALAKSFYDKSIAFSNNSEIIKIHKNQLINQKSPISANKVIDALFDIAKIAKDRNNRRLLAITYSDIKEEYFSLEKYDKALEYAYKELDTRKQSKFNSRLSTTVHFIGEIYLKKNDFQKAIPILESALEDATDSLRLHLYKDLKMAYISYGNSTKAIEFMEAYDALKDSIASRHTEMSIAEITSKYNNEQQKQEIQVLNFQNEVKTEKISNQRLTLFGSLAGSALLLFLGLLLYRNYRSKQNLNYSQLNFKLLQSQLNPHFMFNALNEIKLNLDTKTSKDTSEHLTAYSKLMRLILEGSSEDFVTIEDDVSLISKFLQLQQMVHDDSFNFKVNIDELLDTHDTKLPPMLTQPFVENAILHGVNTIENGFIEVNYLEKNNKLVIEIKDNGKGFTKANNASGKELHQSLGTKITEERIKNYTNLYKFKIETQTSSESNFGTSVKITCPIQTLQS